MPEIFGSDAYSPKQITKRVEGVGVTKARLPLVTMVGLGILAGVFIGLGALYFTLVQADPSLNFAYSRLLGGLAFSLGLILVVVAGAELFTGNNLLVIACATKKISTVELLKNWLIIWISNFIGSVGLVAIVFFAQHAQMNGGAVGAAAVKIAAGKTALPFVEAFFKGILCNMLVCLAVWLAMAGRSVTDKILGIIFPISAFVAAGFEHSVANMYFIPLGLALKATDPAAVAGATAIGLKESALASLNFTGLFHNLLPVTLGNIVGGGLLVALVYYIVYQPHKEEEK